MRNFTIIFLALLAFVLVACTPATSPAAATGNTIIFEVPEDAVPQAWAVDITGPAGISIVNASAEPRRCDESTIVELQCLWLRLDPGQVLLLSLSAEPSGCAFWAVVGTLRFPCLDPDEAAPGG